jgi:hypothetical protein
LIYEEFIQFESKNYLHEVHQLFLRYQSQGERILSMHELLFFNTILHHIKTRALCPGMKVFARYTDLTSIDNKLIRLGIRGTQVKSSIQDIMDEVAPIKKAPLWG